MDKQSTNKSRQNKGKVKKVPSKHTDRGKKKKKNTDGPTCSMFLSDIARKWAKKKKQAEDEEIEHSPGIVHSIIRSISNVLPVNVTKKPEKKTEKHSSIEIENLQQLSPELVPNNVLITILPTPRSDLPAIHDEEMENEILMKSGIKVPKMPLTDSDVMKFGKAVVEKMPVQMKDQTVNTTSDRDVATEIAKHVTTLRKISMIAEEFNQKTAKTLKEIVDSVQGDLEKKLNEINAETAAETETRILEHTATVS